MSLIYSPGFRRKALDCLLTGRSVADVAKQLGITQQSIYNWRRDAAAEPAPAESDHLQLIAAREQIATLQAELKTVRRANEFLTEAMLPTRRFAVAARMASEGIPIGAACRVTDLAGSSYYALRKRPPLPEPLDRELAIAVIREAHARSDGAFGARRIHAELTKQRHMKISLRTVAVLMRRAGLRGQAGHRSVAHID